MKDLNDLKKKYKELGEEIERMESTQKRWRAEIGGGYYFINTLGTRVYRTDIRDRVDNYLYSIGNYFQTEAEAELYRDRQILLQELKDFALEHNDGDGMDIGIYWQDTRYCICPYAEDHILPLFSSHKVAQKAIEHFGNRLDILYKY